MTNAQKRALALATLCLLIIAVSRILRVYAFDLDAHEIWSVWQSQGSAEEILRWTPYDWGPLSFLLLGGWQALTGSDPAILRMLSILAFVFGCACVYALARQLATPRAALLSMLAYAASIGMILLSLFTRGYAFLIAVLPLSLLLALRYLDRPTLWRAAALALSLAFMVYIHPTGVLAAGMIGLYTLGTQPRRVLRWWLPGAMFVLLIVPELLSKLQISTGRLSSNLLNIQLGGIVSFAEFYAGPAVWLGVLWAALLVIATVWMLRRSTTRAAWMLLAWAGAGIVLLRLIGAVLSIEAPRHSWWIILPVALWIGWGLARLPRAGAAAAGVLLAGAMFAPLTLNQIDDSAFANPPLNENFRWLTRFIQWGDVVVIDPNANCSPFTDEWDTYTRLYFPNGLTYADDPGDARRVWYVASNGWDDPEVRRSVENGRLPSIFVGPPECVFQLFVGAPDPEGVLYENGMRFHGVEVLEGASPFTRQNTGPLVWHEGETVHLRLWWSADERLSADYSVAVHLYEDNLGMLAQADGAPQSVSLLPGAASPAGGTSTWTPNQLYVETRTLILPDDVTRIATGFRELDIVLIVYQWWDNVRIEADETDSEGRLPLLEGALRFW